jgi:Uma2 family endonuclease
MAVVAHPQLDLADFVALQDSAGWKLPVEFLDGEAIVLPPAGGHAASAQGELFYALRRWRDAAVDQGLVLQDVFVRLPGGEYVVPDIAWWPVDSRPRLRDGALEVVPALVVEVLSPKTRDYDAGAKRGLYLASGVSELWLVDPLARQVIRSRPARRDEALLVGGTLASDLLAGFALPLAAVFLT